MSDAKHYRDEAFRCRELAMTSRDPATARHWQRLADQYAVLAEELDASAAHRTPLLRMPAEPRARLSRFGRDA